MYLYYRTFHVHYSIKTVVVTNQITTRYGSQELANQSEDQKKTKAFVIGSGDGQVTAALGNTWSHSINTRLLLQYHDNTTREVMIAKSPVAPFTSVLYTIQDKGIVQETMEEEVFYKGTDPGLQSLKVRTSIVSGTDQIS
ncbi:DNA repair protein RAD51 homolog 2-like [Anneissia japonica]|uniref:DNA repair protein RAD51 homolog 2-like n=1 Tax=Anneissia japonica TaxID=1529436 RepID=UPI00142573AE|nr:DNA repair protein RAD51 homolog 2-like [Anneissia japonica]